jgi:hypothetical protein
VNKRDSGPPRRPRNPVAKVVRTPAFRMRVEPDKRWRSRLEEVEKASEEEPKDESKDPS